MKNNILLTTYSRSGSHLLVDYLEQTFDIKFSRTDLEEKYTQYHSNHYTYTDGDRTVITIIRNPFDSISSIVAMERRFFPDDTVENFISKRLKEYEDFYEYIIGYADYVIKYETLLADISAAGKLFSKVAGIPIKSNSYNDSVISKPWNNHVKTSKDLPEYQEIREKLSLYDLSYCESLYKKALEFANI